MQTVIETITVTPTFESLAFLAAIVIVRTAVSWTLTLETEGRWPWQVSTEDQDGQAYRGQSVSVSGLTMSHYPSRCANLARVTTGC